MEDKPIDWLVKSYVTLRDKKRDLEAQHKAKLTPLDDALDKLNAALNIKMNALGGTSLRTEFGTVIVSVKQEAQIGDWAAFHSFVAESGRFDMLQRRVSSGVVVDYTKEIGEAPPGVTIQSARSVSVRASTAKD